MISLPLKFKNRYKMIEKSIEEALNNQIASELDASMLYLSMSAWCDIQGMKSCAEFLMKQSDEERAHMMRIYNYLLEVDCRPILPSINSPKVDFESIQKLFQEVYQNEKSVTRSIHQIADKCHDVKDFATLQFIQWYVVEQIEEENVVRTILDRIKLIGDGPHSLYLIDQAVKEINSILPSEEEAK